MKIARPVAPIYEYNTEGMRAETFLDRDIRRDLEPYVGQYCFICGISGGLLARCSHVDCSSTYHPQCVDSGMMGDFYAYIYWKNDEGTGMVVDCPKHHCKNCFAENKRTSAFDEWDDDYFNCKFCTASYHRRCRPAGCPYNKHRVLICPNHIQKSTVNDQHIPYCFGCRRGFGKEQDSQDPVITCSRCVRSFHKSCGETMTKMYRKEVVCQYCIDGYSVRAGEYCHAMLKNRFVPAISAEKIYEGISNINGLVPIFPLISKKNHRTVIMVHRAHIIPMLPFEKFEEYYEKPSNLAHLEAYRSAMELVNAKMTSHIPKYLPIIPSKKKQGILKARFYKIKSNRFDNRSLMRSLLVEYEAEACSCEPDGDERKCYDNDCVNRQMGYECPDSCECLNGPKSRRNPNENLEVVPASWGGWALRATAKILAGTPIGEYVGRVIDEDETNAILEEFESQRNQESALYLMCLTTNPRVHLDSRRYGSITRYANHSCNPNTRLERIIGVDQLPHQMLYAKCDIQLGEEIRFDYSHSWTLYNPRCFCGSERCSGYLSYTLNNLKARIMPKFREVSECKKLRKEPQKLQKPSKKKATPQTGRRRRTADVDKPFFRDRKALKTISFD